MGNLQPHIRFSEEEAAKYAILPGDPKRVDRIAKFLDDVKEITFNREYKSVSGYYKGVKVIAMSTGMGGPSTAIGVEELANIGVEAMIRIGSCGALRSGIKLGDLVIVNGAVRDDGTSKAYIEQSYPSIPDTELLMDVIQAAKDKEYPYHVGIGRSHDCLYGDPKNNLDAYWGSKGVISSDMETATLFVVGSLRGVKTASILNNVVEVDGDLMDGINSYVDAESAVAEGEKREIITALEAFVLMDKK
ncbi:MAG: nucleoside phosphorylase [Lachnospiraceae bacterium]|nr:nucleoside phosphorylase [Lachnospiraceae bacterium]MBQ2400971.1 nucleoside phosphorylase [Lachnospiraceae bacterium]MBQ5868987.1 nucleoside phosphorylase [Lachnospiraceae bacterium]MBR0305425.1 nucleoside phosphorylase [Lachnospiraceae bacterium]